jgi:predicted phosphodiesterase
MKIALISDIHEDIHSLIGICEKVDKQKIDKTICLGDISGFSLPHYYHFDNRNASECLQIIRDNCDLTILGNHDLNIIKRLPQHDNYFDYPENWYDLTYQQKKDISKEKLWLYEFNELDPLYYDEDIKFLKSLNEVEVMNVGNRNILLTHYVYPNTSGSGQKFYFQYHELKPHFELMKQKNCTISFFGHTHYPGIIIFYKNSQVEKPFRKTSIKDEPCCISVPAVAKGKNKNGFLIFDSEEMSVRAVKI